LHDDGLQALAVLGGHRESIDMLDWFAAGHPSEHLLQMAVFVSNQGLILEDHDWPALA